MNNIQIMIAMMMKAYAEFLQSDQSKEEWDKTKSFLFTILIKTVTKSDFSDNDDEAIANALCFTELAEHTYVGRLLQKLVKKYNKDSIEELEKLELDSAKAGVISAIAKEQINSRSELLVVLTSMPYKFDAEFSSEVISLLDLPNAEKKEKCTTIIREMGFEKIL